MREGPQRDRKRSRHAFDVWCADVEEEARVLRAEVAAMSEAESHPAALLLYELGRIALARDNEVDAAQYLLRCYTQRPQFRPTIRIARQLYRRRGDLKLVRKLLDAELRATRDPFARAALHRQHARLLWMRQGNVERAREQLERALQLDATDLATLKLLELLQVVDEDVTGHSTTLKRQIDIIADGPLKTALWVDYAMVHERSEPPAAAEALERAAEGPGDVGSVLLLLEQHHERCGNYRQLAQALLRQAEQPATTDLWKARLLARAGRIHLDRLDDADRAAELLSASVALFPEFGAAADCFAVVLRRHDHPHAIEIGTALFDLDDSPAFRAALACHLGDICRREIKDPRQAASWYQRCLVWSPSYQPALEGLSQLLDAAGEVDTLLRVHRADLAAAAAPHARAERLYRIGALLERHGRASEAMEAHRKALATAPGFLPSLSALERLFTRLERWSELLQLYEDQLGREQDDERTTHLLETMAAIWYHQIGHVDHAIDCYQRLLERDADNLPALRAAARLCAEARRWADLVALNEREVSLLTDPQRKAELLQRTGEVWEDRLFDLDAAIDCYQRALDHNPQYLPALRALGRLFRQKGRWRDLIEMHRTEAAACSDPEQIVNLLETTAEVYHEELLDDDSAIATYREILARKPGYLPTINALTTILENRGQWRELAELLETTLDTVADCRGKAVRLWRVGMLRETHLDDPEGAIRDYQRALRLAPALAPAQAALTQLLEETGDFGQLIDLLTVNLERAGGEERAVLSARLAALLERQGENLRQAVSLRERWAEHGASPIFNLWSLARGYQQLGMEQELCTALERLAAAVDDRRFAAELELQLGELKLRAGAGDPTPHLEAALELRSGADFSRRCLERHARATADQALLARSLDARLARTKDPLECACLLAELGDINQRRGDDAAAETAYREALGHCHDHLTAIAGLARLLERHERWAELAELAELEASVMESTRELAEALVHAAEIREQRLGDVAAAAELYQQVLRVQPGNHTAYRQLRAILIGREEWAALASLIRAQITATEDEAAVVAMFTELGELYLDRLGQQRKGEACLRRVLELDVHNNRALELLGSIYFTRGDWREAEEILARAEMVFADRRARYEVRCRLGHVYRQLRDHEQAFAAFERAAAERRKPPTELLRELADAAGAVGDVSRQVDALERLAETTDDSGERITARKRAAYLAEERLDQESRAVRALQEVLALDPLDLEAIERLAAIYGRAGDRAAVDQHLQAAVAHHRAQLAHTPFEPRLYHQIGRIFRWQRQFDRLFCSCVVLSQLQGVSDAELQFVREHSAHCSAVLATGLTPERFEQLVLPAAARGALRQLLHEADPALRKLVSQPASKYGLGRSNRVGPKQPLHGVVNRFAALFGGADFDLWISPDDPELVAAAYFNRPALVIGRQVAEQPLTPKYRFRIGHALFLLAERALFLQDRAVRELRALFGGLGRVAQPAVSMPALLSEDDERAAADEAARLEKLFGRKDRRLLGQLLAPLAPQLESADLGDFARALGYGANRCGLLLACDPLTGLGEATRFSGGDQDDELADLLQYIICEEYFTLRVELGIAPGSA